MLSTTTRTRTRRCRTGPKLAGKKNLPALGKQSIYPCLLVLLIILSCSMQVVADEDHGTDVNDYVDSEWDDGKDINLEDNDTDNNVKEEYAYDDFISEHYVEIDPDHDCRDDAHYNCTKGKTLGICDVDDTDHHHHDDADHHHLHVLVAERNLCPVTCGLCDMPNRTSVWVEESCFRYGQDIHVFFTNTDPEPDDYVGIYPSYFNVANEPTRLEEPEMWFYSCGSVVEECRTAMGGLIFGEMGPSDGTRWRNFPLLSGSYQAVLARGDERTVLATSQTFVAKSDGHSCSSECIDLIYADETCYTAHDDRIVVTFEICVPRDDDKIVIYPHDEEDPGTEQPLLWLTTCGTQDCTDTIAAGTVEFGINEPIESGSIEWPLQPGEYRAFLMRTNEGGKYGRASAKSTSFTIRNVGESCFNDQEDL